jgi:hypothetical protein
LAAGVGPRCSATAPADAAKHNMSDAISEIAHLVRGVPS